MINIVLNNWSIGPLPLKLDGRLSRVNEEPHLNLVGEEPGGITRGRKTNARLRLPTDMNGKLILV